MADTQSLLAHPRDDEEALFNQPHNISQLNREERTGVCSVCGPTRVNVRKDRKRVECQKRRNYWDRKARSEGRKKPSAYFPSNTQKRSYRLKGRYRLTPETLDEMLREQSFSCAVCHLPFVGDDYHVDHDHDCCSGRESCGECVRGLLCASCNRGLGQFQDNIEVLANAIAYLSRGR